MKRAHPFIPYPTVICCLFSLRQLHSEREAVPDAPAVYFVRPTAENIKRIIEDCSKQVEAAG